MGDGYSAEWKDAKDRYEMLIAWKLMALGVELIMRVLKHIINCRKTSKSINS